MFHFPQLIGNQKNPFSKITILNESVYYIYTSLHSII